MFNWFLDKLINRYEKKIRKQYNDGIPLLFLVYHAEKPVPNILFNLHPMIKKDDFLHETFQALADHLRDNYLEVKED